MATITRNLVGFTAAFLFLFISLLLPVAAEDKPMQEEVSSAPPVQSLRLVVKSTTWRKGKKPFDIENYVRRKCQNTDFRLVDPKNPEYDATLSINYQETRGNRFSELFADRAVSFNATNITCTFVVTPKTKGRGLQEKVTIIPDFFESFINFGSPEESLYQKLSNDFCSHPSVKYIDKLIAAVFGQGDWVAVLIGALKNDSLETKTKAAQMLGRTKDKRVISALLETYQDVTTRCTQSVFFCSDWHLAVKRALQQQGWKPSLQEKVRFHLSGSDHFSEDAQALRGLGSKAIPVLSSFLKDEEMDVTIRANAALALGDLKNKAAMDALLACLQDKSSGVRKNAIKSLSKLGDPKAIPPLEEMAQSENDVGVRGEAQKALEKLKKTKKPKKS